MVKIKLLLKVLTGLLILFNVNYVNAQNIIIPDTNFKNALLNHSPSIDNDGDREISVSEAQAFTGTLNVSNKSISNLIGIHEFTRITALECQNNDIASLDLRGNFALTKLYCNDNSLTNLDVSKNTNLIFIYCYNNKLTNLDVSANIKLTRLYCYFNQLANLDVSANAKVTDLRCNDNQLTSLNIANGNNSSLASMQAFLNSNLTCIQTDANIVGTSPNNWEKDATASYNENCSTASVNEVSFNDRFKIYPNPVGSILTIKTDNTTTKNIEIYNILGKKILKTTNKSINVSKLVKGIYIVKIQNAQGEIATKKIIKK